MSIENETDAREDGETKAFFWAPSNLFRMEQFSIQRTGEWRRDLLAPLQLEVLAEVCNTIPLPIWGSRL